MALRAVSRKLWPVTGRLATCVVPAACIAIVFARGAAAAAPVPDHSWRTQPYCGVNATYVLLKMYDRDVTHSQVQSAIPVTKNGCSMNSMRNALVKAGLPARVVIARPEQLSELNLPVIAHLEVDSSTFFQFNSRGHFVVLFDVGAQDVRYIDGTTGVINTVSLHDFVTGWSGYLLVVDSMQSRIVRFLPAGVGVVCIGLISLVALKRRASLRSH